MGVNLEDTQRMRKEISYYAVRVLIQRNDVDEVLTELRTRDLLEGK